MPGTFTEAEHPRWPKGTPGGKGGEFMGKAWEKWATMVTPKEADALTDYQAGDFQPINLSLRYGDAPSLDVQEKQDLIDSALAKASTPEDVTVFRGMRLRGELADALHDGDIIGAEFDDSGFVSTTLDEDEAMHWATHKSMDGEEGVVIAELNLPAGTQAGLLDAVFDKGESEILLPRDTSFRVVGESYDEDGRIQLELVT